MFKVLFTFSTLFGRKKGEQNLNNILQYRKDTMDNLFEVLVLGRVVEGQEIQKVKENLTKVFKISSEKVERLLSNKPVIVKKNVSREQAKKIKDIIRKAGAECKVVKKRVEFEESSETEGREPSDNISEANRRTSGNGLSMDRVYNDECKPSHTSPENPYVTPQANLFEVKKSACVLTEFKKVSTWTVFFLSFITLGIYNKYWIYSRTKILNKLPSVEPIGDVFINSTIISWILSFLLNFAKGFMPSSTDVSTIFSILLVGLSLAGTVLPIIWAFKFKNRLKIFANVYISNTIYFGGIMTFFFQTLYLSYKLNESIKNMEEHS